MDTQTGTGNGTNKQEPVNLIVLSDTGQRSGILGLIIVFFVILILVSAMAMGWCFGKDLYKNTLSNLFD